LYRTLEAAAWDGTIGEKVKILAKIPLKSQPGTKWEYGLGIDVAGYLVEVFSGTPLNVYMKTKIFDPLEMDDTVFFVPEKKHNRLVSLCTIKNDTLKESEGRM
jgi:CubicO group peptidase (beta-lactamase class C family)